MKAKNVTEKPETPVASTPASGSGAGVNTITAPKYGYGGIDMMALLSAVMERYKDIPENEMRAGLQWFISKYGERCMND